MLVKVISVTMNNYHMICEEPTIRLLIDLSSHSMPGSNFAADHELWMPPLDHLDDQSLFACCCRY